LTGSQGRHDGARRCPNRITLRDIDELRPEAFDMSSKRECIMRNGAKPGVVNLAGEAFHGRFAAAAQSSLRTAAREIVFNQATRELRGNSNDDNP
jgi:hypothetical protein